MIKQWLRWLWHNENGFFGIGQGPSSAQKREAGLEAALANFATSEGEADILKSDEFFKAILSGDPSAMARVLGPEFGAIAGQSEQEKKTAAEFGTRSGGTTAGMQRSGERARSQIDQLMASLTGTAAGELGGGGRSLLGLGSAAHGEAFNMESLIQKLKAGKWNDIFGSAASVASGIAGGFGGGAASLGSFLKPTQISSAFGGPSEAPTTTSDVGWTIS